MELENRMVVDSQWYQEKDITENKDNWDDEWDDLQEGWDE